MEQKKLSQICTPSFRYLWMMPMATVEDLMCSLALAHWQLCGRYSYCALHDMDCEDFRIILLVVVLTFLPLLAAQC